MSSYSWPWTSKRCSYCGEPIEGERALTIVTSTSAAGQQPAVKRSYLHRTCKDRQARGLSRTEGSSPPGAAKVLGKRQNLRASSDARWHNYIDIVTLLALAGLGFCLCEYATHRSKDSEGRFYLAGKPHDGGLSRSDDFRFPSA
jgi:hypothetical protein